MVFYNKNTLRSLLPRVRHVNRASSQPYTVSPQRPWVLPSGPSEIPKSFSLSSYRKMGWHVHITTHILSIHLKSPLDWVQCLIQFKCYINRGYNDFFKTVLRQGIMTRSKVWTCLDFQKKKICLWVVQPEDEGPTRAVSGSVQGLPMSPMSLYQPTYPGPATGKSIKIQKVLGELLNLSEPIWGMSLTPTPIKWEWNGLTLFLTQKHSPSTMIDGRSVQ